MKSLLSVTAATAVVVAALGLVGCGSSSSPATTPAANASSLTELPSVDSLVSTSTASADAVVKSTKTITGEASIPLLKDISADTADKYFWGGLLAKIITAGSATPDQINSYWSGEGSCRMAQATGFAFQQIQDGGTSLCYMQNAPLTSGVSITGGSATPATIFTQDVNSKVIEISTSGEAKKDGSVGSQTIFARVYGTSTTEGKLGYASDLWFCKDGAVKGYEKLRVDNGAFTNTSVHTDGGGNFVGTISAKLTTSGGLLVFDPTQSRSGTAVFQPDDGTFNFISSVEIDSAGLMTTRNFSTNSFGDDKTKTNTNKVAVFSNYSGNTMDTLKFTQAGFAVYNDFGGTASPIVGATEWQTSLYAALTSGALYDDANKEDFSNDIFLGTSSTLYTDATADLAAATTDFDCTTPADDTVAMDFTKTDTAAVATQCESSFANFNFCDNSPTIMQARQIVFQSQVANFGKCSTGSCVYKIDGGVNTGVFACQAWADNNKDNSEGITTANADCGQDNCCTLK